jgi:hypothetical protein
MAFDDRPKLNERIAKSEEMCLELQIRINKLIKEFEVEKGYEFLPYELDSIFLDKIKRNHSTYLKNAFSDKQK